MTHSHIKGGGGFIFTKNWLTGNQEKHVKVALYIFISEIQKLRKKNEIWRISNRCSNGKNWYWWDNPKKIVGKRMFYFNFRITDIAVKGHARKCIFKNI